MPYPVSYRPGSRPSMPNRSFPNRTPLRLVPRTPPELPDPIAPEIPHRGLPFGSLAVLARLFQEELSWFSVFGQIMTPRRHPSMAGWLLDHTCAGGGGHLYAGFSAGCPTLVSYGAWISPPGLVACIDANYVKGPNQFNQVTCTTAAVYRFQAGASPVTNAWAFGSVALRAQVSPNPLLDPSPYAEPFIPLSLVPYTWPRPFPDWTHGGHDPWQDGGPVPGAGGQPQSPPETPPGPGERERKTDHPVLAAFMLGAMIADRLGAANSMVRALYYAIPGKLRPTRQRIGVYAMANFVYSHLDAVDFGVLQHNLQNRQINRGLAGAWWGAFSSVVVRLGGSGARGWAVYHSVASVLDIAHHSEVGQEVHARRAKRARSRAARAKRRRNRRRN